jgi:hypothetical protein
MAATKQRLSGTSSLRGAPSEEARREAARLMGMATTEAKQRAARENGKKSRPGPGRTPTPLREIACTCLARDAMEGHRWDCPRGQAIKRRQKAGRL